jgi:hypothetical protein
MGHPVTHFEVIGKVGQTFGSGPTPGYAGHVSFYVEVPDVEAALSAQRSTTPPDRPAASVVALLLPAHPKDPSS